MEFSIDNDFALFYGIMLGDGCLSLVKGKKKFISISGSIYDDLDFYQKIILPILFRLRGKSTNIKFRKKEGKIELNFVDQKLFDFINSIGFPIGKKGSNIVIPEIFYQKGLVKEVIQGYFSTDGSIVLTRNPDKLYPRLEIHGISAPLIKQSYDFFVKNGLYGHFYLCKRNKVDIRWQDKYRVQFNGIRNLLIYKILIGFVNPKHLRKFIDFQNYLDQYPKKVKVTAGSADLPTSCL